MKIHTDLTAIDLTACFQRTGITGVDLYAREYRSSEHERRLDVHFAAPEGDGRAPTVHSLNGMPLTGCTWDEWGMFVREVFTADPGAIVGPYTSREHFDFCTADRFEGMTPDRQHAFHEWERVSRIQSVCTECGAVRRSPRSY